ncbi:MAG: TatD family hydrolase [bacterium]
MISEPPRLIDTHAHLDDPIFDRDLEVVMAHARSENVGTVTLGRDYVSSTLAVGIAERYQGVYAAVGLHPLRISGDVSADDRLVDMESYRRLAVRPKVVAVGETGLDFHDLPTGRKGGPEAELAERIRRGQKRVFGQFLELSRELRLPLLLHCRDAHDEMLELLENWDRATKGFDARGVVHCFSGTWKQARRYFGLDFMISVTGTITHGGYQGELLRKAPLSKLLVESDCPFQTAVPWGMRRSEPAYVRQVAAGIASLRRLPVVEVERQLSANARRMFRRIRP